MSYKLALAMVGGALFAFQSGVLAQTISRCNPNVGRPDASIECLTKVVHSLNDEMRSLQTKLDGYAKLIDLSAYLRRSDFDNVLSGYGGYKSAGD